MPPIFDYHCPHCNQDFDAFLKPSDPELKECRLCGKPGIEKVIKSNHKIQIKEPWRKSKQRMA